MSVALYRKYRSKSLDEIVGQAHVTDILRRALATGSVAHAYLLTGPRGVGKTSIARILAHEINGLEYTNESEHLDIIEIDAASNNGVDDVRELREKALIAPTQAQKKIYIIDEVHMLSRAAFNALLKILEEPPEHIVFILATTDFDKLPDTIVSRTQRFHFRAIEQEALVAHLADIAAKESIAIDTDALELIGERSQGSLRDALSLLDQIRHSSTGSKNITRHDIEHALGLASSEEIDALFSSLAAQQASTIIKALDTILVRGVSAASLATQLAVHVTRRLSSEPQLVHLLEGLIETPKSSHPETKLLVTLLSGVVAHPKTVTLAASTPPKLQISAPAPSNTKSPIKQTQATEPSSEPTITAPAPIQHTPFDATTFDWQKILEHTKLHYTALYSILSKCSADVQPDRVVLYAGRKFNKTKLEGAKFRPLLGEILAATGVNPDVHIEILDSSAPPKDSQAAAIAAMMGGGEEVDV